MAINCKYELEGYCNKHTNAFCDAGCVLYRDGAICSDQEPRKKKIVYLAGKMTGLPDYGRARFNAKAAELTEAGYIVINPAMLPVGLRHRSYMQIAFAMLDAADAIYLLNNWRDSPGAHLEHQYASYQHKEIIYEGEYENENQT